MKKQDKHLVDQFFKENIQQDFPYDPALWNKAEKGIASYFLKKRIIIFSAIFLFISSVALFLLNEEAKLNRQSAKNEKESNLVVSKENETRISYNNQNYTREKITDSETQKETVGNTTNNNSAADNSDLEAETNLVNKSPEKKKLTLASYKYSGKKNTKRNKKANGNIETNSESQSTPSAPIDPDTESKEEDVKFTLVSKPLKTFEFESLNKKPETQKKNLDPKKKRFATTIEFEQLISTRLTQQLSQLPTDILVYRNQYETAKNATGFALNVMLQRNGFGIITGIGQQSATLKTSYVVDAYTYEFVTKYRMLQDSVPRPSGPKYFSSIREYNDTTATHIQPKALEGQADQNTFSWLCIPLKVSYQYPIARFRFSLRAGADFNWLYHTSGYLINNSLNGLVAVGDDNHTLNKFTVSTSGQIMAGYQLNHKLQVGGSLFLSRQLRSDFNQYGSRMQSHGFGWYVRYNL